MPGDATLRSLCFNGQELSDINHLDPCGHSSADTGIPAAYKGGMTARGHQSNGSSSKRARGSRTWERQYVFVAATMPEEPEGARGVSVDLRRRFPNLQWLAGRQLHQAQQQLRHTWLPVSDATWEPSLMVCHLCLAHPVLQLAAVVSSFSCCLAVLSAVCITECGCCEPIWPPTKQSTMHMHLSAAVADDMDSLRQELGLP